MRALQLDPDTAPVGRQPSTIQIAPSRAYPWYGSIVGGERGPVAIAGGDPFTTEQQRALIAEGRDVPTAPRLLVKRQASDRELWWPLETLPPVFAFFCPVLGTRRDGNVKIVSPSGAVKHVAADGWAHRPFRRPRAHAFDLRRFG